jgi:hypothetical protein
VRKAIIKGMDDLFLEMVSTWVRGDDFLAITIGNIEIAEAEHVHFDPSRDQGDFWLFMLGNTWRGMQSNGVPDDVDGRLGDSVLSQKLASAISAVDLKSLRGAAILLGQAHVIEHGPDEDDGKGGTESSHPQKSAMPDLFHEGEVAMFDLTAWLALLFLSSISSSFSSSIS